MEVGSFGSLVHDLLDTLVHVQVEAGGKGDDSVGFIGDLDFDEKAHLVVVDIAALDGVKGKLDELRLGHTVPRARPQLEVSVAENDDDVAVLA